MSIALTNFTESKKKLRQLELRRTIINDQIKILEKEIEKYRWASNAYDRDYRLRRKLTKSVVKNQ